MYISDEAVLQMERQRAKLVEILKEKEVIIDDDATLEEAITKAEQIGQNDYFESFLNGTLSEIKLLNPLITTLGKLPFASSNTKLSKLYIPYIQSIIILTNDVTPMNALIHLYAPELTFLSGQYPLGYMSSIKNIILPKLNTVNFNCYGLISGDSSLERLIIPKLSTTNGNFQIGANSSIHTLDALGFAIRVVLSSLSILIFRNETNVFLLSSANNLPNIEEIYVPQSMLETYKTATNWSIYADRFIALEGSKYEAEDWYLDEEWYKTEEAVWQ